MSEQHASVANLTDIIEEVRASQGLIHNLPPAATQQLAEDHRTYTTTEERDPGSFKRFHNTWEREQSFATIAKRVGTILGRTQQYQEAIREGILGEELIAAFGSITRVECDDVHLADADKVAKGQKGIVMANETRLHVPSATHADKVGVAIQGLLSTGSLEVFYPVSVHAEGDDSGAVVKIGMLDEHAARSMSRSVEAVVAETDKKSGVTLPPDKRTYAGWRARGETFPPVVDRRLRKAATDYKALEVHGTYTGRPDLAPRPKPHIIGNDAAAFFEGVRDIFNGLIHDVRGGSHLNLEQHPIKEARPLVEADIDLRRDKATLEDVKHGPLSSRPASLAEKGLDEGRERIEDVRKHPIRALAKGISSVMSLPGTVLDVAGSLAEHLPAGAEAGQELAAARKEWKRRKEAAAAGGERLDALAHRLRRKQEKLIIWEE